MRDDINLDYYKKLLDGRLEAIKLGHEAQLKEGAPVELDQSCVGRLSRMGAMQQQAMAQATARRTEQEKQRIQTALSRLQSGDYGYCVKCDEEITEGRLKVDPATLICINCARKAEGTLHFGASSRRASSAKR